MKKISIENLINLDSDLKVCNYIMTLRTKNGLFSIIYNLIKPRFYSEVFSCAFFNYLMIFVKIPDYFGYIKNKVIHYILVSITLHTLFHHNSLLPIHSHILLEFQFIESSEAHFIIFILLSPIFWIEVS